MKICWDSLEGIKLTKNGFFIKNNTTTYVYVESCKICGEPYLCIKDRPTIFCSKVCAHKHKQYFLGKKHSQKTIEKMSKAALERSKNPDYIYKLSEAHRGSKGSNWKGGVSKKGLPLYDTYNKSLWPEEVSFSIVDNLKLLNVKCTRCNKWFVPSTDEVQRRLKYINTKSNSECRFYCSVECKHSCSIYKQIKYPKDFFIKQEKVFTEGELKVWSKEVIKRSNNVCEYCGDVATIAHHIEPKKLQPYKALDIVNGIACCKNCHFKFGHKDECNTAVLSHILCK